jgi:drug/metabolite transporter (DMT)-like permease
MEKQFRGAGFVCLFVTFFLWGSVYVAGKLGSAQMHPLLLGSLRCTFAVPVLLFLARRHLRVRIDAADRKYFLAVGLLGYFLTIALIQLAIHLTGASVAALLNSLTPVSIMLLAALLLKERITPVKLVCLALAVTGAIIVAGGAQGRAEVFGVLAALLSTVSFGAASVFVRKLTAKYPPVLVTAYGMVVSLLLHVPVGIIIALRQPPQINAAGVATVLYLAVAGSGIAQLTWAKALACFPAGSCSLFYPLQAAFSALLGAFILKERLAPAFFLGLAFVAADVALSTWATAREQRGTF